MLSSQCRNGSKKMRLRESLGGKATEMEYYVNFMEKHAPKLYISLSGAEKVGEARHEFKTAEKRF